MVDADTNASPEQTASSEEKLLERLKNGEEDAATALYLRYAKRIHRLARYQTAAPLARQLAAEDVVQTVFRTFFRRVADGQYTAVDGGDLWKLLLVIALNKIRKTARFMKAQKRDMDRSESVDASILDSLGSTKQDEEIPYVVLKMTIEEMVADMPEVYRQAVQLRIEGHTVNEISERTGRAKRSVERILQEFRANLTRLIEECDRESD